ncbi:MAG: type VI secretion system tip protein VgrG [Bacteroidia bacterium]|nr:MAG: type VI secretion system tip protein VgrG [Bacteroidia bacterium]
MTGNRTIPTTRPATVVTPVIKIDGTEIARTFLVDSISVSKEVNRIPRATVVLIDGDAARGDFQASNQGLFIPGKEIEIHAGYQSDVFPIFKGIIIAHNIKIRDGAKSLLLLECRDKSVKMTAGRKSMYFTDVSDQDVFTEITAKYDGLETDLEASTLNHKKVVQYECTDWDFMVSRAEAIGKLCIADDGKLSVKNPDLSQEPDLTLTYGSTILELDAEMDARHQPEKVISKSWSFAEQKVIEEEADDPGIMLNGNLTPKNLADAIGNGNFLQKHDGNLEQPELQAWGKAMLQKRQLAKIRGRVKCKGVHHVKPGKMIDLQGVGDRFNGKAFVSGVKHSIFSGDWQMDIQFGIDPEWFTEKFQVESKPASGLLAAIHGLHTAKVIQLGNDPDGEERIKIHIPIMGDDSEGVWARLASSDAGDERGFVFRPEIGDEVIVGFVNDDPRFPVVLGILHSSANPAPIPAKDDNHQKGYISRSGLKLVFDDDKKYVEIESPAGKIIKVDEDADHIRLEDQHGNKIVMDSGGIRIESSKDIVIKSAGNMEAEGGMNLDLKANVSLKAEGGSGAELSTSGMAVIKGSIVQIN